MMNLTGDKLVRYLTELDYSVRVVPSSYSDGSVAYMADHPDLPGCMSHGDTPEESIENLRDARREYIAALVARNELPPIPLAATTGTSGQDFIWVTESVGPTESFGVSSFRPITTEEIQVAPHA